MPILRRGGGGPFPWPDDDASPLSLRPAGRDEHKPETTNMTATATTLRLWVANQPEGSNCDTTECYIAAADWAAPAGVTYSFDRTNWATLSGDDPETVWAAFLGLRAAVASAGHGDDSTDADGEPSLVACLPDADADGLAESYQRRVSGECRTWAEFVTRIAD